MNYAEAKVGIRLVATHRGSRIALQDWLDRAYPRGSSVAFSQPEGSNPCVNLRGMVLRTYIHHDGTVRLRISVPGVDQTHIFTLDPLTHAVARL